jgi:hypothetical protein
MTRLARMVVAGLPHHVTQRGNRREAIFFEDGDHDIYRDLLAEQTRKAGIEVWAYRLMPNHVHLILTPMLLQYALHDEEWMPLASAKDYAAEASGPKTVEFYDADHALNAKARLDRDSFLRKTLQLVH